MNSCSNQELHFVVFLIHQLAKAWSTNTTRVYKILNETNILDEYIIDNYDCLHTLGANYLIEDLTEFVKEKGVEI